MAIYLLLIFFVFLEFLGDKGKQGPLFYFRYNGRMRCLASEWLNGDAPAGVGYHKGRMATHMTFSPLLLSVRCTNMRTALAYRTGGRI